MCVVTGGVLCTDGSRRVLLQAVFCVLMSLNMCVVTGGVLCVDGSRHVCCYRLCAGY